MSEISSAPSVVSDSPPSATLKTASPTLSKNLPAAASATSSKAPGATASDLPVSSSYLPQDPFVPRFTATGPVFLDTGACVCALRDFPDQGNATIAWRCQGSGHSSIYAGTTGKWFLPSSEESSNVTSAIDDASSPPDTNNAQVASNDSLSLIPLSSANQNRLSIYDKGCTGVNETTFSTAYNRAAIETQNQQRPIDAAPCWREGALPIPLMKAEQWQPNECASGFFCPNNTVNSIPQYCYPLEPCAKARLAGQSCNSQDLNLGMGPFEPVMCTPGYYCPKSAKKQIRCPAGSYCPPGSEKAIPCSAGSSCQAGSRNEATVIPFGVLVIFDAILVGVLLFFRFRTRCISGRKDHQALLPKRMQNIWNAERKKSVNSSDDEADLIRMEARVEPVRRAPTELQAALDQQYMLDNASDLGIDTNSSAELTQFVHSMSKIIDGSSFGLSFGFQQLSFQPKGFKLILSQISGAIASGSLVGVMGGSGAGKSTFVNVLMGRTTHTGGTIKVNGITTQMKKYKKIIGYVPQDDIVLPELTVRENILHSARIRLPSTWSDRDIQAHADAVVDVLEISHIKDSQVGSVERPIISGGQRKRVSIGMELAAAPMALFLDEPTSGLDATAASSIMRTLKALSQLGMSIIVIIHQPRVEIFEMIDDLILLGNGRLIYQGREQNVQDYFHSLGFEFPEHCNAGDVVTDIITGNGRFYKSKGDISKEALISHWESITSSKKQTDSIATTEEAQSLRKSIKGRGAPWFRQIHLCLMRALLQQWRNKTYFWFEVGVSAFAGLLIGLAQNGEKGVNFQGFFNGNYEILSSAINYKSVPQMSLLVCISIGLIASAPGVRVFGEEYLVFRREASSGHSRFAYYIAKIISTIPRMVVACFHFTVFFILLSTPIIPWTAAFTANLMYFYCIYGLASIVSMIVRQSDGPLFAVMASLIVGVLSGAAPPLRKVDSWHVGWLWRASPGVWLAEIYFGKNVAPLAYLYDVKSASQYTGFQLDRYTTDLLVLLLIGTIYRIVAYGGLLISGTLKR